MQKVYVIFGANSDIGKVLSLKLKEKNYIVIDAIYHNGNGIKCDITNEEDVINLYKSIIDKYSYINGVINCACLCIDNDYRKKSADEFLKVLNTNLVGTFNVCKHASLYIKNAVILSMSSLDGINTFNPYSMDYSAAKAGINNLIQNFALADKNNTYLSLCPAWIDTKSVREMDRHFVESEMSRNNQKELLKIEDVVNKIIDMLTNNNYTSGIVEKMEG